jgi:hypothetical protein
MHEFLFVCPKVVVAHDSLSIVLDAQSTLSVIHALQVTVRNLVLFKFTMRPFKIITALTEINVGSTSILTALLSIDAKLVGFVVAGRNRLEFAILSNKTFPILIHGVVTITKVLIIGINVNEACNALASIVARMVVVVTRFVFSGASADCAVRRG